VLKNATRVIEMEANVIVMLTKKPQISSHFNYLFIYLFTRWFKYDRD